MGCDHPELRLRERGSRAACGDHDSDLDLRVGRVSMENACREKTSSRETDPHPLFLRLDAFAGCIRKSHFRKVGGLCLSLSLGTETGPGDAAEPRA